MSQTPSDFWTALDTHSFEVTVAVVGFLTIALCSYLWNLVMGNVKFTKAAPPPKKAYDWVVIGAGPGGCSAATQLRKQPNSKSDSILVVDGGVVADGSKLEALSLCHSMLRSDIDVGCSVLMPFSSNGNGSSSGEDNNAQPQRTKVWYPRGSGVGGTSNLDWALHFVPASVTEGATNVKVDDETKEKQHIFSDIAQDMLWGAENEGLMLSPNRNPVSWAFAEACAKMGFEKVMPDYDTALDSAKVKSAKFVAPLFLRVAPKGTKTTVCRDWLTKNVTPAIDTALGWKVIEGTTSTKEPTKISGLVLKDKTGQLLEVSVSKGVFVCGGALASPQILSSLLPSPYPELKERLATHSIARDAVTFPLVYQTRPGLSNDSVNIHGKMSYIRWLAGKPSTLNNPVADTVAVFQSKAGLRVSITMVPFGGLDKELFLRLGRSEAIGVFGEAMTLLVTAWPNAAQDQVALRPSSASSTTTNAGSAAEVMDALKEGFAMARDLVQEDPLCRLTTSREALDVSLFPAELPKKQIVKVLYGKPLKKTNVQIERAAEVLRTKAKDVAFSEDYMTKYICTHATYAGFACGSLHKVENPLKNVWIGDASVVDPATLARVGGGGTVAAASLAGWRAAKTAASL